MAMVTAGALMYHPERVQFYCIAASGPQLAALAELPHVASVVSLFDTEGVNRLLATVGQIVEERERTFAARGLDMAAVREAKFGRQAADIVSEMSAFRSGRREATVMGRIAKGFTDDETRAIAEWLAAQAP